MGLHRKTSGIVLAALTAAVALADADMDFRKLLAKRDALAAALEKQPAQEVVLRFDEGADRDDAWIILRRSGGEWREAFAEVPGWHQGTMKDWRTYFHGNYTYGCWRPNLRWPADATRLAVEGERLQLLRLAGAIEVPYRLDMPMAQRLPAGEHAQWWDKFIAGGHTIPRRMTYTLEADVAADRRLLELVLEGGVYWDSKFVPNPKAPDAPSYISRRPIVVRLHVPSTRFTSATVRTPSWYGGYHEADATGLKFENDRLVGSLLVYLQQDGWGPWGRGKHTQHESLPVRFEVDARLDGNELTGRYTASFGGELKGKTYNPRGDDSADVTLPDTRYDGAISGRGGPLVVGRYSAKGDFEDCVGAVDGMLFHGKPVRECLALHDGDLTVGRVGTVLHQIRALHLALQTPALPYETAWVRTDRPTPVAADLSGFLAAALRMAESLPEPQARPPEPKPETVGDSPSHGAQAAPVEGDDLNVLPADAPNWFFLSRWHVLGSFEQRPGTEHDAALAPDLVVLPSAGYRQTTDRFGLPVGGGSTQRWQAVTCGDSRLGLPGERPGMFPRYVGQTWWGTAALRSEKARTVWLSLEANDFAKLWVNDRLAWTDGERGWRYRPLGRVFVPVQLVAGGNRLLARVHSDRQVSWLRLALTTREPATPALPPAPAVANNPFVFADARPPLVWDLAKGINVAWRAPSLGGGTRPVVVADTLFVTGGTNALTCVDIATGHPRWTRQLADGPPVPAGRSQAIPPPGPPLAIGNRVAFLGGLGTLGCFDAAGAPLWARPTELQRPKLRVCAGRFIVEGQVPPGGKRDEPLTVRLIAFDAATGAEAWQRDLPGTISGDGETLELGGAAAVLSCTGAWLDAATGEPLPPLDVETQAADKEGRPVRAVTADPYRQHFSAGMLFLTSQARHVGVRTWVHDGRLGAAQAWESNYGSSGFGNVGCPGVATDRYLFTWHSSLAHTPHCPDPRAEVNVQDARTGRWIVRHKPIMTDLYSYGPLNLATPVVAGPYLFLLGGRSGNQRNQIAAVTADDRLLLVARQDVEPGTTQPPVFAGERLFLRSPQSLLCVAATTAEGRRHEKTELARTTLRAVGREPRFPSPPTVPPLDRVNPSGAVPVGELMHDRSTELWLGAGPYPARALSDTNALAAVRAQIGMPFASQAFAPLSREFAYNEPPAYLRTSELQGTGDITPRFASRVDPRCVSSPTNAGLLYTVLDNARERVVVPALARPGIEQWLGGRLLKPGEPLRLAPGLYPYLVRVDPAFYRSEPTEILPPVNVTNALAKGAIREIGWPTQWRVLGPLPGRTTPLTADQLRQVPRALEVDGWTDALFAFPVRGNNVELGSLVHVQPGQEPDLSKEYVRAGVPVSAYAFAEVDCPADGYLYVSTSGEASLCWYVDGEVVYDRLGGLWAGARDVSAHPFAVRVTKGRHVLAVQVRPGAGGWSFCSVGGFSEKRGDQLAEFTVESKIKPETPDFRLRPCFLEVPQSPAVRQVWLERARSYAERLEAVAKDLPGTAEARSATATLAAIRKDR